MYLKLNEHFNIVMGSGSIDGIKNKQKPHSLKEALKGKLTKKEFAHLRTSFDMLGNIAIIEIPSELVKKEKIIGKALLEVSPNIETVCKKTGAHKGKFRVEPVKIIAGKKNRTATYRESGCTFRVSLGKVFFSPRLSAERLRIAGEIKKGEIVAVLFAGVGPFPIVFAKNSEMKQAFAVELNPAAFEQLKENVELNKVQEKVVPLLGDVKRVVPKKLKGKCGRVVMPLPKGGEHFLHEAFLCLKGGKGIIHFYDFVSREKGFDEAVEKIKNAAEKEKKKVKVLLKRKVRDYSPDTFQAVIDFRVSNAG